MKSILEVSNSSEDHKKAVEEKKPDKSHNFKHPVNLTCMCLNCEMKSTQTVTHTPER